MASRTITGPIYGEDDAAWASQTITFALQTNYATAAHATVLNKPYEVTTDANGAFTATVAVPDSDAWLYRCSLPDGTSFTFNLTAGSATTLQAIIADNDLDSTVSAPQLTDYIHESEVLDEDDMATDSAVYPPSQQSTKAYVDNVAGGGSIALGGLSDVTETSPADNEVLAYDNGTAEWINQTAAEAGLSAATHATGHTDGTDDIQDATAAQKGVATAAQITKLDGIETAADVTDATNVAAAGALMQTGGTMSGDIAMADNSITRAVLKDYGEETVTDAGFTGAETIDIEDGNVIDGTLIGNATFTFSNPSASGTACSFTMIIRQDGTGSRTVTWPASVDWPAATAPTLTTTATTGVDVLTFLTVDAGTTWLGFTAGQAFG